MSKCCSYEKNAKKRERPRFHSPLKSVFMQTFDFSSIKLRKSVSPVQFHAKTAEISFPYESFNKVLSLSMQKGPQFLQKFMPFPVSSHVQPQFSINPQVPIKSFAKNPKKPLPHVCEMALQTSECDF